MTDHPPDDALLGRMGGSPFRGWRLASLALLAFVALGHGAAAVGRLSDAQAPAAAWAPAVPVLADDTVGGWTTSSLAGRHHVRRSARAIARLARRRALRAIARREREIAVWRREFGSYGLRRQVTTDQDL